MVGRVPQRGGGRQGGTFGSHHSLTMHASAGIAQLLNLNNLCRGGLALAVKLLLHVYHAAGNDPRCAQSHAWASDA